MFLLVYSTWGKQTELCLLSTLEKPRKRCLLVNSSNKPWSSGRDELVAPASSPGTPGRGCGARPGGRGDRAPGGRGERAPGGRGGPGASRGRVGTWRWRETVPWCPVRGIGRRTVFLEMRHIRAVGRTRRGN